MRRYLRTFLFTIGTALLIGVTFAVQNYIMMNNRGYPITWRDSWVEQVPFWAVWALLSPIILNLTHRFPLVRERMWKTLLMHLPLGIVFSFVHFAIYIGILVLLKEREVQELHSLADFVAMLPRLNFGLRFWTYLLLMVLGYATDFYRRYQEGMLRTSRLEMRLAQAQLEALKMQLHPHFLFNTLNSISALLRKDLEAADRMIARLGDFLRMTLRNSGKQEVTVEEELNFLKCYLEIERIRFQDRLTVKLDIAPETLQARVPNLLLQPIVENALRHGLSETSDGTISVQTASQDGRLRIRVHDNGPGLPEGAPLQQGVGLQNTRSRLEQLYGAEQQLDLYNSQEGGFTVELHIPYRVSEESQRENTI